MEFAALIPIFSALIDRLFPDKEKQDEAKIEMQKVLEQAAADEMKSKSAVVVAEASSSSWIAASWRPLLMMSCVAIISNNWIFAPLLNAVGLHVVPAAIPPELWTLVTIGVGGYIGHDTISTYSANKYQLNTATFYTSLRKHYPQGLKQSDVDAINSALTDAEQEGNSK